MNEFIITSDCKLLKNWYDLERLASIKGYKVDNEASLFDSKWTDYRILHPVNSNIIFFEEYKWLYRVYYRKFEDSFESRIKQGVRKPNLYDNDSATIKAIIKGRVEADKIGIPYGLYISFAIRLLIKNHLWQHLPRPCHLYNQDLVEEIRVEWQDSCQYDFLNPNPNIIIEKIR